VTYDTTLLTLGQELNALYLLTCVCGQVYAYDFAVLFIILFFHNHRDLRDSSLLFVLLFFL